MSVQLSGIGSPRARGAAGPVLDRVGALCSCTAMSLSSPAGEVIVVRVAGEVDLFTMTVLQDALTDSLARGPCDLLVDLAAMTFCDVRGMTLLVQAGASAAERGIGYAVAATPHQVNRVWPLLWPINEMPMQFPSAAAGVLAAMAQQPVDDLARWAPKHGPGWVRRWPTARWSALWGSNSLPELVTCGDRRSEQVTIAKLDGQRTALTAAILDS